MEVVKMAETWIVSKISTQALHMLLVHKFISYHHNLFCYSAVTSSDGPKKTVILSDHGHKWGHFR